MRIQLIQSAAVLGHFGKNLTQHLKILTTAQQNGIDLVIFPELSLTGYLLRDLTEEIAISPETLQTFFQQGLNKEQPIEFVVGYVEQSPSHRVYNSAAHFSLDDEGNLHLIHNHRKVNLPTYGMFDENRYFYAGMHVHAYDSPKLGRCGLLICEDMWHLANPLMLSLDGPELEGIDCLIAISNSPARGITESGKGGLPNIDFWHATCLTYAQLLNCHVLHCQRVGVEDGFIFSGGSLITAPDGTIEAVAPMLKEHILEAELELEPALRRGRQRFKGRSADDFLRLRHGLDVLSNQWLNTMDKNHDN